MRTISGVQRGILTAAVAMAAVGWLSPAAAADITDVADAADVITFGKTEKEDFFDLYVGVNFSMILSNGKITREPINRPGVTNPDCTSAENSRDCLPVDELRWKRAVNVLDIEGQVGLFHDIALTYGFHYVLGDTLKMRYAKGVTAQSSSVTTMQGADQLFGLNYSSKHAGWGPVDIGLRVAPLSDERDDSKPTWVVFFNWANPWMSKTYNPATMRPSEGSPGPVGDGSHRLTFGTALSKRVGNFGLIGIDPEIYRRGYMDPYMEFTYTVPISTTKSPRPLRGNSAFGARQSHEATLAGGVEIVAMEDLKAGRRVALDLGLRSAFYSEGRNYSLLTDPLNELTYTEQYLSVGGILGIYIQAAEFVRFKAGIKLDYNTEHFLTFEEVGEDNNDDGQVFIDPNNPRTPEDDVNPYFCGNTTDDLCQTTGAPSYDQVGFRFKDEEHTIFTWFASLIFTF